MVMTPIPVFALLLLVQLGVVPVVPVMFAHPLPVRVLFLIGPLVIVLVVAVIVPMLFVSRVIAVLSHGGCRYQECAGQNNRARGI